MWRDSQMKSVQIRRQTIKNGWLVRWLAAGGKDKYYVFLWTCALNIAWNARMFFDIKFIEIYGMSTVYYLFVSLFRLLHCFIGALDSANPFSFVVATSLFFLLVWQILCAARVFEFTFLPWEFKLVDSFPRKFPYLYVWVYNIITF